MRKNEKPVQMHGYVDSYTLIVITILNEEYIAM